MLQTQNAGIEASLFPWEKILNRAFLFIIGLLLGSLSASALSNDDESFSVDVHGLPLASEVVVILRSIRERRWDDLKLEELVEEEEFDGLVTFGRYSSDHPPEQVVALVRFPIGRSSPFVSKMKVNFEIMRNVMRLVGEETYAYRVVDPSGIFNGANLYTSLHFLLSPSRKERKTGRFLIVTELGELEPSENDPTVAEYVINQYEFPIERFEEKLLVGKGFMGAIEARPIEQQTFMVPLPLGKSLPIEVVHSVASSDTDDLQPYFESRGWEGSEGVLFIVDIRLLHGQEVKVPVYMIPRELIHIATLERFALARNSTDYPSTQAVDKWLSQFRIGVASVRRKTVARRRQVLAKYCLRRLAATDGGISEKLQNL